MSASSAALFVSVAVIGHPNGANRDPVDAFVERTFGHSTYKRADADLNGDGRKEVFAYLTGADWCGSGGCWLVILSPRRDSYRVLVRTTVTRLPIMLLPTSTHGWRDVGVTLQGGGVIRPYHARLRFNGRRYPGNPTIWEPRSLRHRPGRVLISW
jgi:hypothetical protein